MVKIAGISNEAIRTFSKRRAEVLDEMDRHGTHTARGAFVNVCCNPQFVTATGTSCAPLQPRPLLR